MRDKLGSDFFSAARRDKPGYRGLEFPARERKIRRREERSFGKSVRGRPMINHRPLVDRCTPLIRLYTRRRGLATAPIYRRRYCSGAIVEFIPGEFAPRPRDADDESVARDVAGNFKRAPWISANWRDCVQGRTRLVR